MKNFFWRNRWWVLVAGILIISYLITRLSYLTSIPIFTDEAIYIRWSQIGSRDANWRLISLTDGKQPLFTWITMVLFRLLHDIDPLLIGRLVSVIAGIGTAFGLWILSFTLFHKKEISFLSVFLYIINPFPLMYDRLALYDSLSACFYVWNMYIAVLLVRKIRTDIAFILGFFLAGGMLNKTSGFLSLYLLPVTLIFFDWKNSKRKIRLMQWIGLVILATGVSQSLYSVLRLSPLFHMIGAKDVVFVYSFSEWLTHPFRFVQGNLLGLFDWLIGYITQPIFISALLSFVFYLNQKKEKLFLISYWILPFIALGFFGKVLYPRYILFMAMPLFILCSVSLFWLLSQYGKKIIGGVIFSLIIFQSIWTSYTIITRPLYARIPDADRGQIIDDWPAGGGIQEVVSILKNESQSKKIAIYTDGTFGLLPFAIELYLVDNSNIAIKGIWPVPDVIPEEIIQSSQMRDTYMILNQSSDKPLWPMIEIGKFQKGMREDRSLRLYKIIQVNSRIPSYEN